MFVIIFLTFALMCYSFLGAMFPLPQIIYAMALDGLLFPFLGSRSSQFKTPLVTTLISGLLTGNSFCNYYHYLPLLPKIYL